jgi:predicted metal-dependent HD superfamily phosphohydrolase
MKDVTLLKNRFFKHAADVLLTEEAAAEYWQLIHNKYSEKSRHYHNLEHLRALFASFDQHHGALTDPTVVAWAIWYHDVIYNARRRDNEEQSAILASKYLAETGLSPLQQTNCLAYIRATGKHLDVDTEPESDLAYFLDFDLAVLAWSPAKYQEYAAAIRKEYRHVPGFLYRRGRRKILRYFLAAPVLFRTAVFQADFEEGARANLEWELGML